MDNEPYSIEELKETLADAMYDLSQYGWIVINDEYHQSIIIDVLNAEIKRREAKSRKNRNKKSEQNSQ